MYDRNTQSGNHKKRPKDFNSAFLTKNKTLLITIAVATILLISLWIWKSIEMQNIYKDTAKEKRRLEDLAVQQIVQSREELLKLMAKPYVWAVRAEMLRGNINQVNLYANDLVKQKNVQCITIANDKGIVVSSTNKKDEGKPFSAIGTDAALSRDTTYIENVSDSILIMTSPIMGFNNRLGTLLIRYAIPPTDFQ